MLGADKKIEFTRLDLCTSCNGTGCESGTSKKTCNRCGGSGQLASSQGFFTVMHECPTCKGSGVTAEKPCRKCSGSGTSKVKRVVQVRIPPGVDTGTRMRVAGEGEPGLRGGSNGDLFVITHVKEHPIFHRDGDDIFCEVPIDFPSAALGGEIEIPTVSGKTTLQIPPGTQTGEVFSVPGKGMPSLRGHGRGDQHVKVFVEVPKRLSADQKDMLRKYAVSFDSQSSHPIRESFLEKAKKFFQL